MAADAPDPAAPDAPHDHARARELEQRTLAIVLAGGGSTRLGGRDKTRLPVAGTPSLERVLRVAPAAHLVVVGPEGEDGAGIIERHGCRFVREEPAGSGPLAAVARGLDAAPADLLADPSARVLLLAGDMPLLRTDTLERLQTADPTGRRVVALAAPDGHLQYLCASWPAALLRRTLAALAREDGSWTDLGMRRLYGLLAEDELRTVPAVGSESHDLDTPEDVDAVHRAAGPRIALAQIRVSEHVAENLSTVARTVAEAARAGARLVVLPEATLTPFGTDLRAAAEQHHAELVALLEELADRHGIVVVAGSFTPSGATRVHNTLVVRGPAGADGERLRTEYAKIHLFDAYGARESDTVAPGDRLVTLDLDGVRLGLATCYDVRFPAQFTALARAGAQAVLLPLAWGDGPGKREQLQLLLRARALDATTPVLAADQAPPEHPAGPAPRGIGRSAVIGPLGQLCQELGREEGMLLVDLDLAEIAEARRALPVLEHERDLPGSADAGARSVRSAGPTL